MKKLLMLVVMLGLSLSFTLNVGAAQPSKDQVKSLVVNAENAQRELFDGEYYARTSIDKTLSAHFQNGFINKFVKERMTFTKKIKGIVHYALPGSDDMHLIVTGFSWDENTKVTYKKTSGAEYITVTEYIKDDEMSGPHTYTVKISKNSKTSYKIYSVSRVYE